MSYRRRSASKRPTLALGLTLFLMSLLGAAGAAEASETFVVPKAGLVDQAGRPYDGSDGAGRVRIVYFGFTNCPEICPTTLWELHAALASLAPADHIRVQPIFVSVDPLRDTPEVLETYLQSFDPAFVGVGGTLEAIDAFAWNNGIYVARNDASDAVTYTVDHTSSLLVVDPAGTVLDRIPYGASVTDIAERITQAIDPKRGLSR
ncbi:SCO family protein [Aureimonas pseudogalii]|uniref:Protein SCO1/2 n=1 Tax=Aureimonas pseudogalii TaxID=1744844 RepID=A0A7W6H643_9HYPH|nr:SCO family protein [Aureimonas pseudogalii]MBB3999260.1 protein SCO1/2 [Aureimonas pseudogalii]